MPSHMEFTFQGFEEAEYFDFDVASRGFAEAEAVPCSYMAQDFEMAALHGTIHYTIVQL